MAEAGATVSVYAMHNAKGGGGATLLGTATADATGVWSFASGAQLGTALHFTATATDTAGNVGASSPTYNMTVINTTSDSLLSEPSLPNGSDHAGLGDTPLFQEHPAWWSAIHDQRSDASNGEGMFGGVDGTDWQDALWHRAVGPSSAQWQPGHAQVSEANARGTDIVEATQKEHFSFVLDVGWAAAAIPDARMADGEPGVSLEHDRVALFDAAHAANGGAFLL